MSKCFQILLAECYILLTACGVISLLRCWGLAISHPLAIELSLGWTMACFSSAYFWGGFMLATLQVRKPVKAEEDQLKTHFAEVLQQAGTRKSFRLLIQEDMDINAFATGLRTIVVTRGVLDQMEPDEIKALLAHELGHLQSRDCLVSAAFASAAMLPFFVTVVYQKAKRLLLLALHFSVTWLYLGLGLVLVVPAVLLGLYHRHFLLSVLTTILFVWLFRQVRPLFLFCWKMVSRFREYEQDAYACGLGFGAALRRALLKSTAYQPQKVSLFEILMGGDHPVIYNRIRRLEKLEGLR